MIRIIIFLGIYWGPGIRDTTTCMHSKLVEEYQCCVSPVGREGHEIT